VLFIDEADALLGKRTTISDAHDKYANQEVSYQAKSPLQMQPLEEEEEEELQATANGDQPAAASAAVETGINQKKGSGQLLPPDTRSAMESRFGADFSRVNVHTNPASIHINRELNSQAFTVGNNIFFNSGSMGRSCVDALFT
jgi:phosphotransferase system HPr-like phosphotransfer protein